LVGLSSLYSAIHEFCWKSVFKSLHRNRTNFLVDLFPYIGAPKQSVMLGLGIAEGDVDYLISKKIGLNFVGLDIAPKPLFPIGSNYTRGDASLLPFKGKAFGLISAFSLVEHIKIESRINFFAEIFRVLQDDGWLVIQLPNRYFPIEQHTFLPIVGYLPDRFHNYFNTYYCRVPSLQSVKKDLVRANYKILGITAYEMPLSISPIIKILKNLGLFKLFPFGFLIICKKEVHS
jgi:SAM-dependent methyltransferase